MGAQTVQERSGEKNSFGYRNENLKTSDLDSADCVAKICWIIVPAATSEDFFFRRISCTQSVYVRSVGFCFFILNLFKYFVDFFISICLVCLKPDMFWLPRSEKKDAPPSTI